MRLSDVKGLLKTQLVKEELGYKCGPTGRCSVGKLGLVSGCPGLLSGPVQLEAMKHYTKSRGPSFWHPWDILGGSKWKMGLEIERSVGKDRAIILKTVI